MALPASPPISMSQICTEFGAPANTPLASFLRGGSWVPDTPGNAAVPTALPISMLQLLGASAAVPTTVAIGSRSVGAIMFGSGLCLARYELRNDGVAYTRRNAGADTAISGEWLVSGAASAYDVRYTHLSGDVPAFTGGSLGAWINMATGTVVSVSKGTGLGVVECAVLVEIRPTGGGATLDSAEIDLSATREDL